MIKKLCHLLLVLSLLPITACHKSASLQTFTVPESFDTTKQHEITFWAKNDTNKTQVDIYKQTITDFETIYPNIKVNLRLYTDYGKIFNDVITNISTGTTPDVCIFYPDHIATYLTGQNVVVPLDDLVDNTKFGLGGTEVQFASVNQDEVIPKYLEEGRINDTLYALPFMRSTEAVYINETYVNKLGYTLPDVLTWDFIFEVSRAAMKQNADGTYVVNGQKVMIPFIYKSTDNMMIQMLKQLNAGYSTEDGEIEIFNDETRKILQTVADYGKDGSFSTFKQTGYPANFLNAGQCIFAIDSTAGSTWMGSKAPLSDIAEENKVDFQTAIRMVPQYHPDSPQMISQGPSICLFNKQDSQQVLASWLFAQYLLTNQVQITYSETEGYVPVTSKAQNAKEYQEYLSLAGADANHYDIKIQVVKMLMDHVNDTFVTPVFNGSTSLRNAAGQLIEDTVKAVRRNQIVDDQAIDTIFSKTASLYRLDQIEQAMSKNHKTDLGPLPTGSKALLVTLFITWILIAIYFLKRQRNEHTHNPMKNKQS